MTGHFYGALDPKNQWNSVINDLLLAPRNASGLVEYSATFTVLRPADPSKASGVLWYEVPNRGNSPLNPRPSADALAAGHILVSSGWQGDLAPRAGLETISVPVARNADGSSITGPVLYRIANVRGQTASLQAGYAGLRYQTPATLDTTKALLTRQASDDGEITPIPSSEWAFANCDRTPFPGEPDPTRICLKAGFDPDLLYQVVYTAKDPLVLGIGLAATRDLVSFLRYSQKDDERHAEPGRRAGASRHWIRHVAVGQLHQDFLHLGFNQDESKRIVWDGANPNIAARQNPLNFRFAIPGGAAGLFEPGSEGVLWWSVYRDDVRGRPAASLLDRCRATGTCPKIMETFGSSEFWGLRMSPGLVGTDARSDIPLPPERAPVLLPRRDAWRRPGRIPVDRTRIRRTHLCAAGQSEFHRGVHASAAQGVDGLGGQRCCPARKPISDNRARRTGCPRANRDGLSCDPRRAAAGQHDECAAELRLRPRVPVQRSLRRHLDCNRR